MRANSSESSARILPRERKVVRRSCCLVSVHKQQQKTKQNTFGASQETQDLISMTFMNGSGLLEEVDSLNGLLPRQEQDEDTF